MKGPPVKKSLIAVQPFPASPRSLAGTDAAPARLLAAGALLLVGLAIWGLIGNGRGIGWQRWLVAGLAAGLGALPPVSRLIGRLLARVRTPSASARWKVAVTVGLLAGAYFAATAFAQDRDLFPKTHDDCSYMIQMRMLARGRLWMPQHELADFFDSFYVIVRPVYASLYFPGAALLYTPTLWLGLPLWLMPVGVAAAIVGLLYRVIAELVDGVAGLIAALVLASQSWFRVYSVLLTGHEPMLLFGLLMIWIALRFRADGRLRWVGLLGAIGGWAALTRPVDAVCVAIPVGVAVVVRLVRGGSGKAGFARLMYGVSFAIATATPFLAVQLIFDRGVTGRWLTTPYVAYIDDQQPDTGYGFRAYDPAHRPHTVVQQKQDYYDSFFVPVIREHRPELLVAVWGQKALPMIAEATLPARPLAALIPVGLLGLVGRAGRQRWVLAAVLPLFAVAYLPNPYFLEHYALQVAPAMILLLTLAGRTLAEVWPRGRQSVGAAAVAGIVALCVTTLPELNYLWPAADRVTDETFSSPLLRLLHDNPKLDHLPAVILFRYDPSRRPGAAPNPVEEPVYNTDVAWPDDAPVIRAHDLGDARDRQIIDYYAARQPDRFFYRYDIASGEVTEMGEAGALAARH